jgi:hypothetical protein
LWFFFGVNFFPVGHLPKVCTIHYRQAIRSPEEWERLAETSSPVFKKELTAKKDKKFVLKSMFGGRREGGGKEKGGRREGGRKEGGGRGWSRPRARYSRKS